MSMGLKGFQKGNKLAWKGGKPKCLDCERIVSSYHAKRCRDCFLKFKFGNDNPNWRAGETINISCSFCNIEFSKKKCRIRKHNFCRKDHFYKWQSENLNGENSYVYGIKRPDLVEKNKSLEQRRKISKSLMGHIVSEETKKKISESNKGRKPSSKQLKILQTNWIGRKHSEETKRKMSEWQMGEKSPQWLGGISFEPYSSEFNKQLKEKIRQRDNFTCWKCSKAQKEENRKLAIHHIDYNKKNCSESNLISLCRSCNVKVNFNRGYWITFFQNILNNSFYEKKI